MASNHPPPHFKTWILTCITLVWPWRLVLTPYESTTKTKTSIKRGFFFFIIIAIIPTSSTCKIRSNYPGTRSVATTFKARKRKKNSPSCSHVLLKTSRGRRRNVYIFYHACRAIVFLINLLFFLTFSFPSPLSYLKFPFPKPGRNVLGTLVGTL